MDRNYGSLGAMNKGSAIPSRHNRSTWTTGYIIGDPFFLTTISIAVVSSPQLPLSSGIEGVTCTCRLDGLSPSLHPLLEMSRILYILISRGGQSCMNSHV